MVFNLFKSYNEFRDIAGKLILENLDGFCKALNSTFDIVFEDLNYD